MSTFNDMLDFIKSAWPARSFIVPCLAGPPGIGKTAACRQAAMDLIDQGATGRVVTIIASQILPNEVSGITMPVPETKAMEIFDHYRLSSLRDGDILFFDELLEADQMVLSACLTLIESRELMSGAKLPDVMIVAATNPTISSQLLKLNIRQRFLWRSFGLDIDGTREYIKNEVGIDVGDEVAYELRTEGTSYNVLTPRSLTKMATWIMQAETLEQAKEIGRQINKLWSSQIGTKLYVAWQKAKGTDDPEMQARRAIRQAICNAYADTDLDNSDEITDSVIDLSVELSEVIPTSDNGTSIQDIMELLQSCDKWEEIKKELESIEIQELDDNVEI